ncbi:MAG TPA: hypothetical protein VGK74_27815 [Symbiobacteriaceae bacterium]
MQDRKHHYQVRAKSERIHTKPMRWSGEELLDSLTGNAAELRRQLVKVAAGASQIQQSSLTEVACSAKTIAPELVREYGPERAEAEALYNEPQARQAANRLEKRGTLIGPRDGEEDHRHLYTIEEAYRILLVLYLMRNFGARAPTAVRVVKSFLEGARKTGTFDPVLVAALDNVEQHITSRLWRILLSEVFGLSTTPDGTIGMFMRLPEDDPPFPDSDLRMPWIWNLFESIGANGIFMAASETDVVILRGAPPESLLRHRDFRVAFLGDGMHRYVAVIGLVGITESSATVEENQGSLPRLPLISRLVRASLEGFHLLRSDIENSLRRVGASEATSGLRPLGQDLELWLVTRFIAVLVAPDNQDQVQCILFTTVPNSDAKKSILKAVAANISTAELGHDALHRIEYRRLLSGYSSAIGMALAVPCSHPPFDQLVANHDVEQRKASGAELSCIAIPIPLPEGALDSILYVSYPAKKEDKEFPVLVHALEVMGPLIGELLLRRHNADYSLGIAGRTLTSTWLKAGELHPALVGRMKELLNGPSRVPMADADERLTNLIERVPIVLLKAQAEESEQMPVFERWFRRQLGYLIPDIFLGPSEQQCPGLRTAAPFVYGSLGRESGAAILFIPKWMQKPELDRLRASLPSRLNSIGPGLSLSGTGVVRLDVWVIDIRRSRLENEGVESVVSEVLEECKRTAVVCQRMVKAYREAYLEGNWSSALTEASRGPTQSHTNAYLLRRSAEFSLRLGRFPKAAAYAEQAFEQDRTSVSAVCLWGDALLGQGKAREALDKYVDGRAMELRHPLPHYALGQALLLMARILQQWIYQECLRLVRTGKEGNLIVSNEQASRIGRIATFFWDSEQTVGNALCINTVEHLCEFLADYATLALEAAKPLLRNRGFVPETYGHKSFEWYACLLALSRVARLKKDPDEREQYLKDTIESSPTKDDLLPQELMFAYLSRNSELPLCYLSELAEAGVLQRIRKLY